MAGSPSKTRTEVSVTASIPTEPVQPDPEAQAEASDPAVDRAEQHIVEEPVPNADLRSAEAPGVRTEPEVIADEQATIRAGARDGGAPTASPAVSVSARVTVAEDRDSTVAFKHRDTDQVQVVNVGTPEHARLASLPEYEETSAPTIKPRPFRKPKPAQR